MKRMNELKEGEKGLISKNLANESMKRRFLDLGLIDNTVVECVGRSPFGDPSAYLIRGAIYAIRADDCADIYIEPLEERDATL